MKASTFGWPATALVAGAAVAAATVPYVLVSAAHSGGTGGSAQFALLAETGGAIALSLVAIQLLTAGGYLPVRVRFGRRHRRIAVILAAVIGVHAFSAVVHVIESSIDTLGTSTVAFGALSATVLSAAALTTWRVVGGEHRVPRHLLFSAVFVGVLAIHVTLGITHAVTP